ncbi:GIY-YIG nuclease family protein [Marinobacter sp.]|uniref:GIY-YIG nuclease family protein n=1 Tax=Marinobacter sp. TaxID=50741 RepID=UPI003A950101
MKFIELIRMILRQRPEGATPQQLRDQIKADYTDWYGTAAHRRNVDKGHYNNLDHALLAEIYIATRQASDIYADKSTRPMTLAMESPSSFADESDIEAVDLIDSENLQRLEQGVGTVYVLGTGLFTKTGVEIVKIGITTGDVSVRIRQLYTTGVPTKFRVIETFDVQNYAELEQALHKMLDPFRINRAREFFTEYCLPYIEKILSIHVEIQGAKSNNLDSDVQ